MEQQQLNKIINYLTDGDNYKWATSEKLIAATGLAGISPAELDRALAEHYKQAPQPVIRFSTLPSRRALDVLWGHVGRVGKRPVVDIYRADGPLQEENHEAAQEANMFISYSFADSEAALELSGKLSKYNVWAWIAEMEILKREHINEAVNNAITALPAFGVLITDNTLRSGWSAKEIDFALQQGKEVLGFLHLDRLEHVRAMVESGMDGQSAVRQEIFNRIFDNHPDVKFLTFPEESGAPELSFLKERGELVDWGYFERMEALNSVGLIGG